MVKDRFFWFHFPKQSLWLKGPLDDAELMRGFWAQLFGHGVLPCSCGAGGAGAAGGHGSGPAPAGVSGCPHLPAAREGGAGRGAQARGAVPRPEARRHGGLRRGTARAMERGPPAGGAGVRYSAQLQVRAGLGPGSSRSSCQPSAGLPRPLLARVPSSLAGSRRFWILREGGVPAHPWVRSGESVWGTFLSSAERGEKPKNKTALGNWKSPLVCGSSFGSPRCRLLQGFWFQLKLGALGL